VTALGPRWGACVRLVAEHRDVLEARPADDGDPPAALVSRGWASFLLSLGEVALTALEIEGQDAGWPDGAPASLAGLAARARKICAIAPLGLENGPIGRARRQEKPRKRAQIDAFARLVLPLAGGATRVLDVGSGHGHLTRELAERMALPVVGLERDDALAERARALSATVSSSSSSSSALSFAVTDVLRDGLPLASGDCVIGLHACGELGDVMVESAARARASIALVGCCLQKRRALSRRLLCGVPEGEMGLEGALDLPRDLLGLSNLTARDEGVEATRTENLAGRERRLALRRLLSAATPEPLRLGAEIEGLNRRAAHGELGSLVRRAFELRGLLVPGPRAIEDAASWARGHHAMQRRLSLPRAMLARVLEVMVLLDRARYLEEHGYEVATGTLFSAEVSARNLALVATPRAQSQGIVTSPGSFELGMYSL
jgi:SAM-dependent methyltransferase